MIRACALSHLKSSLIRFYGGLHFSLILATLSLSFPAPFQASADADRRDLVAGLYEALPPLLRFLSRHQDFQDTLTTSSQFGRRDRQIFEEFLRLAVADPAIPLTFVSGASQEFQMDRNHPPRLMRSPPWGHPFSPKGDIFVNLDLLNSPNFEVVPSTIIQILLHEWCRKIETTHRIEECDRTVQKIIAATTPFLHTQTSQQSQAGQQSLSSETSKLRLHTLNIPANLVRSQLEKHPKEFQTDPTSWILIEYKDQVVDLTPALRSKLNNIYFSVTSIDQLAGALAATLIRQMVEQLKGQGPTIAQQLRDLLIRKGISPEIAARSMIFGDIRPSPDGSPKQFFAYSPQSLSAREAASGRLLISITGTLQRNQILKWQIPILVDGTEVSAIEFDLAGSNSGSNSGSDTHLHSSFDPNSSFKNENSATSRSPFANSGIELPFQFETTFAPGIEDLHQVRDGIHFEIEPTSSSRLLAKVILFSPHSTDIDSVEMNSFMAEIPPQESQRVSLPIESAFFIAKAQQGPRHYFRAQPSLDENGALRFQASGQEATRFGPTYVDSILLNGNSVIPLDRVVTIQGKTNPSPGVPPPRIDKDSFIFFGYPSSETRIEETPRPDARLRKIPMMVLMPSEIQRKLFKEVLRNPQKNESEQPTNPSSSGALLYFSDRFSFSFETLEKSAPDVRQIRLTIRRQISMGRPKDERSPVLHVKLGGSTLPFGVDQHNPLQQTQSETLIFEGPQIQRLTHNQFKIEAPLPYRPYLSTSDDQGMQGPNIFHLISMVVEFLNGQQANFNFGMTSEEAQSCDDLFGHGPHNVSTSAKVNFRGG